MRALAMIFGMAAALAGTQAMAQAPDGAKLFAIQCRMCHGPTSTPAGPTLKGVAGAKVASRPGYKYSPGLIAKGGTWSDAALDAYLAAPTTYAPGSRMVLKVPNPAQRKALIAHLKTLK